MNSVVIAVAGAGKTEELATRIAAEENTRRVLVLTYTERNQSEDAARIASKLKVGQTSPEVSGWFSFLINQVVRPYLPLLFPYVKLRGLGRDPSSFNGLSGSKLFFSPAGDVYPGKLALLAAKIISASRGAVIRRLERIYDAIYIDEGQDLCGNDLFIVEVLMRSSLSIAIVLDPRQSVLQTSERDQKYKKCRREKVTLFYRDLEKRGLCVIEERRETHRFVPEIAAFSDAIIPAELGFEKTKSNVSSTGVHVGIFILQKNDVYEYACHIGATVLRVSKSAGSFDGLEVANFGECKGMQRDHVVVVATKAIEDTLLGKKVLEGKSLCGFYVAITRARYSVAIAVKNPTAVYQAMRRPGSAFESLHVTLWEP